MKTHIHPILGILIALIFLTNCEKEKTTGPDFSGRLVYNSTCNNFLKNSEFSGTADSLSCIEYVYDASDQQLTLKHINAGFNCCPDYLYCIIQLQDDTILVREYEAAALCLCNCLYDLDMEISGVQPGKYQVRIMEPYIGDQEEILFGIDLHDHSRGTFCVTRKQYPWGMTSITD